MGEFRYLTPAKTDRIHSFLIEDVDLLPVIGNSQPFFGNKELTEVQIGQDGYSISFFFRFEFT